MPYLVRLKPNWPGAFRRSLRFDGAAQVLTGGEVRAVLEFTPGEVCEVDEVEFRALAGDFGHAIEHVRLDDDGTPRASDEPVEAVPVAEASEHDPPAESETPPSETPATETPASGRRRRR